MEKIDYAKQYLNEAGIKIFAGKEQILKFEKEIYPKKELITSFIPDKHFIKVKDAEDYWIPISSYRKLTKMYKYGVLSEVIETEERKRKIIWRLVKIKTGVNIMSVIAGHVKNVEFRYYPLINAIRAMGEKFVDEERQKIGFIREGDSGFIFLDKKNPEINEEEESSMEKFYREKMGIEEEMQVTKRDKIIVAEVPFLTSEDNFLVCLNKKNDMQRILIIGMIGKGKSFGTNSLSGHIFYKFKDNVALIDPIGNFNKISMPSKDFEKDLKRLGEASLPIPAIHLKMSCPTVEIENDITFRLVNNFYNFLLRYKFFTNGIAKYDLGKAERYLNSVLKNKKIRYVKKAEEIKWIMKEMLGDVLTGEVEKGMWAMIFKYVETFEGIFKEQFTDNLFPEDYSEWEVQNNNFKFKANPFNASIYSGLFTVLNIKDVKRYPTFRNRFADLVQQFIDFQGKFKKRTWINFDEMNEFYEQKKGRSSDKCSEMVVELFRQGRNLNIGIIGNTQSYDGLESDIRKNTNILLCGTINTDSERKLIARDYQLDNSERDRLGQLNTFEFMVMSKEPFIFYDNLGNKYEEKRVFIGKIIPPISTHLSPAK